MITGNTGNDIAMTLSSKDSIALFWNIFTMLHIDAVVCGKGLRLANLNLNPNLRC